MVSLNANAVSTTTLMLLLVRMLEVLVLIHSPLFCLLLKQRFTETIIKVHVQ